MGLRRRRRCGVAGKSVQVLIDALLAHNTIQRERRPERGQRINSRITKIAQCGGVRAGDTGITRQRRHRDRTTALGAVLTARPWVQTIIRHGTLPPATTAVDLRRDL